ncbi:hypothetical protein AB0I49_32755 [Streptomyces sp. NPDC050617]|uniref:hypothetical protein n=1 Tax=Streptomyces sp. NPDC050617 TaxID=3154628 RepID=UPI00343F5A7E
MYGQRGAAAWCGRLLLFAALLLGIVTMHTLGHPAERAAGPHHGSVIAGDSAGGHGNPHMAMGEGGPAADSPAIAPAAVPAHGGMDPMSVCLAVLGVWIIGLLVGLAARDRRAHGAAVAAPRSRLPGALWPIPPPPRRKALARLSVLRV